ncbi:MAG: hypothetical protein Q7R86_02045 [bacterium]|nr:hypothetical protein [bacterium]
MNGRTSKALMATAIGFLIGVALAVKLREWNAWAPWISPFAGGLVGYLSYEFRKVVEAAGKAWAEISGWRITKNQLLGFLRITGIALISPVIFLVIAASLVTPIVVIIHTLGGLVTATDSFHPFALVLYPLIGGGVFCISAAVADERGVKAVERYDTYLWYVLARINPIAIWLYWPARLAIWGIPRIPGGAKKVGIFFATFFKLIHSQRRLIIFTWVFLGVSAFLLNIPFWPCFIGTLVGCAASIELIGKRWLGTLPALNGA